MQVNQEATLPTGTGKDTLKKHQLDDAVEQENELKRLKTHDTMPESHTDPELRATAAAAAAAATGGAGSTGTNHNEGEHGHTPEVSYAVQQHVDRILQSQRSGGLGMSAEEALAHYRAHENKDLLKNLDPTTVAGITAHNSEHASTSAGGGGGSAGGHSSDSQDNNPAPSITLDGVGEHKPATGSEEWHKLRKENHKEVERRRRENINRGINHLAEIVPDCDKQKGKILEKARDYIIKLKDVQTQNMEKWTLEKLLTEQAITELSNQNKTLKAELNQAWRECDRWKKACQSNGIDID